ncbi:MAG TPA: hypothetical protein VM141_11695 [Planctomycetota bacterium]|nr:hypothetical protein [Planctomycetota bacterium]
MKKPNPLEPNFSTACDWWADLPNIWTPLDWREHMAGANTCSGSTCSGTARSWPSRT